MADPADPEKEKQWQESLARAGIGVPLDPGKLLEGIRQIQQRQAETGRVFVPGTPAAPGAAAAAVPLRQVPAAPAPPRQAQADKGPVGQLLRPFSGSGSTPARRRFWNAARLAVLSARKIAGRHVSVDEYPGKGTVINAADTSARRQPSPAVGPCDCPSPTGHITATVTLSITDTASTGNCSLCHLNVSISGLTRGIDTTQYCSEFGFSNQVIGYNLVSGDGTSHCDDGGGQDLVLKGDLTVNVGTNLLGADPPCNGTVDLHADWRAWGTLGALGPIYCGSTTDRAADHSFPIANIHQPAGTYVLNQTITGTNYAATVGLTVVIT